MFSDFLVDDITIQSSISLPNGFGGFEEYWDSIQWGQANVEWGTADFSWSNEINVKGLIDLMRGTEKNISDKYIEDSTHILFLKKDIAINHKQRVLKDNEVYRVLYVDKPFNRHKEVYLQKVGVDNE